MSVTLSPQQEKAVRNVVNWYKNDRDNQQAHTLAGFAGTGKSTILPDIISAIGLSESDVAFAAPTGKAAKVMANKLKDQGVTGAECRTIHSLIYQPQAMKAEMLEKELEQCKTTLSAIRSGTSINQPPSEAEMRDRIKELEKQIEILERDLDRAYDRDTLRFQLNPESTLVTGSKKLVVIDEGSMVGTDMAEDLLSFDIPILVMGDPGQLPPVDDHMGFPLDAPDTFLTEIHRQAADNPIIHLATLVRKGERGDYGDYGQGVRIVRPSEDEYSLDLERDAQIIVGTNKTRWRMTSRLRKAAGFTSRAPCEGEPLIMCKNSRQHPSLVNGTPVYSAHDHAELEEGSPRFLLSVYDEDGKKFVMYAYQGLFEEHVKRVKGYSTADKGAAYKSRTTDNLADFGWAITCHKSQGSQWDEVIVHDESFVFRNDADKWLYTAITRAAQRLIIVAPD